MKLRQHLHHVYPLVQIWSKAFELASGRRHVSILLFHEIPKLDEFEKLIEALQNHYDFISPLQFEAFLDGGDPLKRNSILITFDDGYRSSFLAARQVLDTKDIKSVFFVTTDFLGLNDEESYQFVKNNILVPLQKLDPTFSAMSWSEAMDLQNNGHLIASHTRTHRKMGRDLTHAEILDELTTSAQTIEKHLGKKPEWFAYPFGDIESISPLALKEIKAAYKYSFSGLRGKTSASACRHTLPRQSLSPANTLRFNQLLALGGFDIYYLRDRHRIRQMSEQQAEI